jgi:hypothetical protein
MNAIWNTIDELRSQIHPDDEGAHYQLDDLEIQLRELESNVEAMQMEIALLKGGQARGKSEAA